MHNNNSNINIIKQRLVDQYKQTWYGSPFYKEVRRQYLKPYFCRWPTLNKFDRIMSTENKKEILNLAKYIYFATKVRSNVEN